VSDRPGVRGRRRKASDERTRGKAVSTWPSMGIWRRRGCSQRWFCEDRRELDAADDSWRAAAAVLDGLNWRVVRDVVSAFGGTRIKWSRRRERNVLANGCCQETRRKVIGSRPDPKSKVAEIGQDGDGLSVLGCRQDSRGRHLVAPAKAGGSRRLPRPGSAGFPLARE
jgi:hypothetical protein